VSQTVTVVGQLDPATEAESQRSTTALDVSVAHLTVDSVTQLLRDDASVDLEQRGGGGVQADLSIRGSSYEQTLVLLNGLRINDAETSHFNLDVPVPLDALSGAYVLHGAGSTLYGADAVSGVVNLTTARPQDGLQMRVRMGAGSFGGNSQAALASFGRGRFSEVVAGSRDFSSGFIADRDYRSEQASSETRFQSLAGDSDVLLAGSDRAFGASEFYGDYASWERTKGWFAAITQQVNAKTQAALAYRRHSDVFVLYRDQPSLYENNHIDTSWQAVVRRHEDFSWRRTRLDYGVDVNADQIDSTNLGKHGRNRGAGYVNAQAQMDAHGLVSLGLREEIVGGGPSVSVPSFTVSQYVRGNVKLRGAITRGFRMPTYNDLYYSDPANEGNPYLKPEFAWSYEGGVDWYPSGRWAVSATGYTSRQKDVIDYVRTDSTQPYKAENLTRVNLSGAEVAVEWRPSAGQQVRLALTTVAGASAAPGEQLKYAFGFPSENAVAEWTGHWRNGLTMRQRLRVVNRVANGVFPSGELYSVVDSSLAFDRGWVHPYLQMTNLGNTGYQEVYGVPMPGRGFAGGLEFQIARR
jgi:iron complex outermembrane receptor protein